MDRDIAAAGHEPITRAFIASGIESGLKFAGLAAAAYASGNPEQGKEVQAKAQEAHDEALHRIRQAEGRGLEIGSVRERLRDLRDRLAGLSGESS
jgi:hypothetical protein